MFFVIICTYTCGLDIILGLVLSLFPHFELSHFSGSNTIKVCIYLVGTLCAHLLLCCLRSFRNFTDVFHMVWKCACALDIILILIFVNISAFWIFSYLFVCNKKVAGYYVIPLPCLSVRPSVHMSGLANIRGLGASLSMIMRFIPLRIHWIALKPIFCLRFRGYFSMAV